jgi:predicted RNA binding protein YcfA (HicA-like mRNA interferase family)
MPVSLPQVSGREVIKVLQKQGYHQARTKGSHVMMRGGSGAGVTVPLHNPVAPGTLRAIIAAAGLTVDEFVALL